MRPCPAAILLALVLPACARYVPPGPPTPREARPVSASFDRSWDAVIDVFAERNIPIRTIERVSGLIVAEMSAVPREPRPGPGPARDVKADCGALGGTPLFPTDVVYNVVVRGDDARSTVRATARWTHAPPDGGESRSCTTSGAWESAIEDAIRTRAERAAATNAPRSPAAMRAAAGGDAASDGTAAPVGPPARTAEAMRGVTVPVTFYVDLTGPDGAKYPVAGFTLLVVSLQGDSSFVRTDDTGTARGRLAPGRYRVARHVAATFGGRSYHWELPFIAAEGMPAVTLSSENAVRR